MNGNRIGEYLRARRELVRPHDAGLPEGGRRRVAGLRREEVARLAGVSVDYYVRLEQDRGQHPSPEVLDALARALLLDEAARNYLHALNDAPARRSRKFTPQPVADSLLRMIDGWTDVPASVQTRHMDVLAANRLATALAPIYAPGTNLLRTAFLGDAVRTRYLNWDDLARRAVAGLRALAGPGTDDPYLTGLVAELTAGSEEFRRLWARHDVSPPSSGTVEIDHPEVGRLDLRYERLGVPAGNGRLLIVHQAAPGTPSARALRELAAPARQDVRRQDVRQPDPAHGDRH